MNAEQLLQAYYFLKLNRSVEERLLTFYMQNKVVGGLYRSLGQEAISVGTAMALQPQDWVAPLIRNVGPSWCAATGRAICSRSIWPKQPRLPPVGIATPTLAILNAA